MALIPKILAFTGSTRAGSYNKQLVLAGVHSARGAGAEVTVLDLRELNLPLFDEDLEKQVVLPEGGKRLKQLMRAHHGFLIASPEYNSSVSAVLKNAIDWASRPEPGEPPLSCFNDKVAGLLSASPGALGGLRGLAALRSILGNINVLVLPMQFALSKAHEAFDENGRLKDSKQQASVDKLATGLVRAITKLNA